MPTQGGKKCQVGSTDTNNTEYGVRIPWVRRFGGQVGLRLWLRDGMGWDGMGFVG